MNECYFDPRYFNEDKAKKSLGNETWEQIAIVIIKASKRNGYWTPVRQQDLSLDQNFCGNPCQLIAEMIAEGFLVYTEDGYWLTRKACQYIKNPNRLMEDVALRGLHVPGSRLF